MSLPFTIKKYVDCVHYYTPNPLHCHLIAYYNGKLYFGEWRDRDGDGYKEGYGLYYHPSKYIYEGRFRKDKKHGEGTINYQNGDVYEGGWKAGKKEGWGTSINAVGD